MLQALLVAATLAARPAATVITLPGGPPVGMDYLAFDRRTGRLWVPAGNTGRIDVIDTRSGLLHRSIERVATAKRGDRTVGASAATVAGGVVWVGNRADATLCGYDSVSTIRQGCLALPSTPDGLQYVAATGEVWATMPREDSLALVDVKDPAVPRLAATVKLAGGPEGYAVDDGRGVFYTNLEDKDRTLAIDVRSHQVIADWSSGCGEKGPRGIALDAPGRRLFVACTNGLRAFDLAHGNALTGSLDVPEGVDNIDLLPAPGSPRLFVASGKAGVLTVVTADAAGKLSVASTAPTAEGCRTVVVDAAGVAYLPDSKNGRLVVVRAAR